MRDSCVLLFLSFLVSIALFAFPALAAFTISEQELKEFTEVTAACDFTATQVESAVVLIETGAASAPCTLLSWNGNTAFFRCPTGAAGAKQARCTVNITRSYQQGEDVILDMLVCTNNTWDADDNILTGCEYACTQTNGGMEICDGMDNDCDGARDDGFPDEQCSFACQSNGFTWTAHGSSLNCCGNDPLEARPYEQPETTCTDEYDNDCNGQADWNDAQCATLCTNAGENEVFIAGVIGDCDQCNREGDQDGDQPGLYPSIADRCDADCRGVGYHPTVVQGETITTATFELLEETCDDNLDNDCDGLLDCQDQDCNGKTDANGAACCQQENDCAGTGACHSCESNRCVFQAGEQAGCAFCARCDGAGSCVSDLAQDTGQAPGDCDALNLVAVDSCISSPDNQLVTQDIHAAVYSQCSGMNACTSPVYTSWSHTCANICGAECEAGQTMQRAAYYCDGQSIKARVDGCNIASCAFQDSLTEDTILATCAGTGEDNVCADSQMDCNQCDIAGDQDGDGIADINDADCGGLDATCDGIDDDGDGNNDDDYVSAACGQGLCIGMAACIQDGGVNSGLAHIACQKNTIPTAATDCGTCCRCSNDLAHPVEQFDSAQDTGPAAGDCDALDLPALATCTAAPDDSVAATYDTHPAAYSACAALATCSAPAYADVANTCSTLACGAQCEAGQIKEAETYHCGNQNLGLVAYYPFDANAKDYVGSNDGTVSGATLDTLNVKHGSGAYKFNGNSIRFGNNPNFNFGTNDFTISLWYYPTGNLNSRVHLLTKGSNDPGGTTMYGLYIGSPFLKWGGCSVNYQVRLNGAAKSGPCGSGTPAFLNTWHHLLATRASGTLTVYLDGVSQGSTTANGDITTSSSAYIGAWGGATGSTSNFYGNVDSVAIYNRALSQSEAQNLYTQGMLTTVYKQLEGCDTMSCLFQDALAADAPYRACAGTGEGSICASGQSDCDQCDASGDQDGDQDGWNSVNADRCDADCGIVAATVRQADFYAENTQTACTDGIDNDCDGDIDIYDDDCPFTILVDQNPVEPSASLQFQIAESYYRSGRVEIYTEPCASAANLQCSFDLSSSSSCAIAAPAAPAVYTYYACAGTHTNEDAAEVSVQAQGHCAAQEFHSEADETAPARYLHTYGGTWQPLDCDLQYDTSSCSCAVSNDRLNNVCDDYACQGAAGAASCADSGTDWVFQSWTCDTSSLSCTSTVSCGGSAYRCYKTNTGAFAWKKASEFTNGETACSDGYDNDCDGEIDYDGDSSGLVSPVVHGDADCPVAVTALAVSTTTPVEYTPVTVQCTASAGSIRSITSSIDTTPCTFISWSGSTASFSCPAGSVGTKTIACAVDAAKSYVSESSRTTVVQVQPACACSGTACAPGNNGQACNGCQYASAPAEVCDAVDNDCDGSIDEGVSTTYYRDADNDGYGISSPTAQACSKPAGYSTNAQDCNDGNAAIYPTAPETAANKGVDNDCNPATDADNDGYPSLVHGGTDCNDANGAIYPTAAETTSNVGVDNDCNPSTDADNDGYLTPQDCNDNSNNANPARAEICDNLDNNCAAGVDEGCDDDNDNYCDALITRIGSPATCTAGGNDCNDNSAADYPGSSLFCIVGSSCASRDADGDGYLNKQCGGNDCNDNDPATYPGPQEPEGTTADKNCDGMAWVSRFARQAGFGSPVLDCGSGGRPFSTYFNYNEIFCLSQGYDRWEPGGSYSEAYGNGVIMDMSTCSLGSSWYPTYLECVDYNWVYEYVDNDGDGVGAAQGDCNDNDARFRPNRVRELGSTNLNYLGWTGAEPDYNCDGKTWINDQSVYQVFDAPTVNGYWVATHPAWGGSVANAHYFCYSQGYAYADTLYTNYANYAPKTRSYPIFSLSGLSWGAIEQADTYFIAQILCRGRYG